MTKESRIALRKEIHCCLRIMPVGRADAGRVDEDDIAKDCGRVGNLDLEHTFYVFRVFIFGDKSPQLFVEPRCRFPART